MRSTTLRPGLLVSLKTTISGNVEYRRVDVETDHMTPEGTKRAVWETQRTINDPEEHEKAVMVRAKCRNTIAGVCSYSTFGLLCPDSRKADLDKAIEEAQLLARAFNEIASQTRVQVYVIAGRVEPNDLEAVKAINSEVRDLMTTMEQGLAKLDVKQVREAAVRAKSLGQMLTESAKEKIQSAIDVARDLARKIVKAGEEGALVIDQASIRKIAESRTAFLDIDMEDVQVAAPAAVGRAIDMAPEGDAPVIPARLPRKRLTLELED